MDEADKERVRFPGLFLDCYFFDSLNITCFRSFALYFLSSTLRVTSFRFLRVQYTSPVAACLSIMSWSCDIVRALYQYAAINQHPWHSLRFRPPERLCSGLTNTPSRKARACERLHQCIDDYPTGEDDYEPDEHIAEDPLPLRIHLGVPACGKQFEACVCKEDG